ncbi:MAG: hypothetical protein MI923_07915 [Phycisphaerales bacterium]|nr:hypothetical protein [Phycisphaerales bacterium]
MHRKNFLTTRLLVLLPILLPTAGMALSEGIRGVKLEPCDVSITSCPSSPSTLVADDDCMVNIPDLTNDVVFSLEGDCQEGTTVTQSPLPGSFEVPAGSTSVEVVITVEACSETEEPTSEGDCDTAMCSVDIPVELPDLLENCPSAIQLSVGENCQAIVPDLRGQVQKNDCAAVGTITVMQNPAPGSLLGPGFHTISMTVQDDGDPVGECDVDVLVSGDTRFSIVSCTTQPTTLQADQSCLVTVPDLRDAVVVDQGCLECELRIGQSPEPGSTISVFSTSLTIEFTADCCFDEPRGDGKGECERDTCELEVDVMLPQSIECPFPFRSIAADENCEAVVPDLREDVKVLNCELSRGGSFIRVTQTPEPGTTVGVGETEISLLVERCLFDQIPPGRGNGEEECEVIGSCDVTLTVYDNGITVQCPTTQPAAQANPDCTFTVPDLSGQVVVEEDCPGFGIVTISQSPEPGETVRVYSGSVFVRIFVQKCTDIFGDLRSGEVFCSDEFFCFVEIPINPIQSCPTTPQTLTADANCQAIVPDLTGDVELLNCCEIIGETETRGPGIPICEFRVTQSPEAGTAIGLGETVVTLTVEQCFLQAFAVEQRGIGEECVVVGSCEVTLNVVDETPPVITDCPTDPITLSFNANCELDIPTFTATDNCTDDANITLSTNIDSLTAEFDVDADTINVTINGQTTSIPLADLRADATTPLGTISVVVTATDEAGNSADCEVTATVLIGDCPVPPPQVVPPPPPPVDPCPQGEDAYNILFSLLYRAPVCGPCPITIAMGICGIVFLRSGTRRRRRR